MNRFIVIAVAAGFILLTIACYALLLWELKKVLNSNNLSDKKGNTIFNRVWITVTGWALVISALSLSGIFANFTLPPPLIVVLAITFIAILVITFLRITKEILLVVPPEKIIKLQAFRVVVEIFLWAMFTQKLLPVQMTFEGRNLDILSGITAPFVAYYCFVKKSWPALVAVIWNLLCLGLLINVVATAILSMPTPFRIFMDEPANTIVTYFPYVLLPTFLVPLAYGLHFFSLRQLFFLAKSRSY